MKYYDLDKEEQQILEDFENDEFSEVEVDLEKYKRYAKATLDKTKNINIRLPEKTVWKLKAIAASDGIPYQTLAASVLYRFTNNGK